MSKHTNKHWLREKEYISLKIEHSIIWKEFSYSWKCRGYSTDSRMGEIRIRLKNFYNEERGQYRTAPHWYRNMLNRRQRAKSRIVLYKTIMIEDYDYVFQDNYRDAPWYW